jgi:antitoxin CcdA
MKKQVSEPAKPFRQKKGRIEHIGDSRKFARKRAVNVSVDAEVLSAAKEAGLNLSLALEDALRRLVQDARDAKWRHENRAAFESYNRLVEKAGFFGEEFQDWE